MILHLGIALAFGRHLVAPLHDAHERGSTDFTVFLTGWTLVQRDPAHLYDIEVQRRTQTEILQGGQFPGGVMAYVHPPHFAVALAPMARLGLGGGFWLWMLLQLGATVTLVRWLLDASRLRDRLDRWVLATAVLGFLPLLYTLQVGQLTIFMAVALLGFVRAFESGRDARAGLWLALLTIKPQLLVVPLLLVAATRRWRSLAWLCAWIAPAVIATTAVLGPRIWIDYPGHMRHLEQFVGGGPYEHMLNLRGCLTRLAGVGHDQAIFSVAVAALLIGLAASYRLLRQHVHNGVVPAGALAAAFAIFLPLNPHLHLQDALLWAIPLVFVAADLRARALPTQAFDRFALSWPTLYVLTQAVEAAIGHSLPIPPALVLATILAVWTVRIVRTASGEGGSAAAAHRGRFGTL